MNIQASLLAVVPRNSTYTAYFFCYERQVILPIEISNDTSCSLIACEQKILFDFHMNFSNVYEANVEITAKLCVKKEFIENYGIKVTKKMLDKSVFGL